MKILNFPHCVFIYLFKWWPRLDVGARPVELLLNLLFELLEFPTLLETSFLPEVSSSKSSKVSWVLTEFWELFELAEPLLAFFFLILLMVMFPPASPLDSPEFVEFFWFSEFCWFVVFLWLFRPRFELKLEKK